MDTLKEYWLNPPEYDDPIEDEDKIFDLEADLESEIIVTSGDWNYLQDKEPCKELPDSVYMEDDVLSPVYIDNKQSIIEWIDIFISKFIPDKPGRYKMSGTANLKYEASDLFYYKGYEEDGYLDCNNVNFLDCSFDGLSVVSI